MRGPSTTWIPERLEGIGAGTVLEVMATRITGVVVEVAETSERCRQETGRPIRVPIRTNPI